MGLELHPVFTAAHDVRRVQIYGRIRRGRTASAVRERKIFKHSSSSDRARHAQRGPCLWRFKKFERDPANYTVAAVVTPAASPVHELQQAKVLPSRDAVQALQARRHAQEERQPLACAHPGRWGERGAQSLRSTFSRATRSIPP